MSESERADALIARMKAARGYIYPEWELAARQDPEFVEAYNRIYELGPGRGAPRVRQGARVRRHRAPGISRRRRRRDWSRT